MYIYIYLLNQARSLKTVRVIYLTRFSHGNRVTV